MKTTTLDQLITRVKELDEKATKGPWKFTPANDFDDWEIYNSEFTFVKHDSGVPVSTEDGAFIAEARTLLPALAEMLEECLRQGDYYVHTSDTWVGHLAENNRELLKIAKKHGILDT